MQKSTLYIDESGKSSLLSDEQEPFIITGVILDEEEVITTEGFFSYIKSKYNINRTKPFHSFHVYENLETKLQNKSLCELSKTLAEFLSLIPIEVKVLKVDKNVFRKAIGLFRSEQCKGSRVRREIPNLTYKVLVSELFVWFANYLERKDYIGQVIIDSRRGGDHQVLKTLNLCKEGHLLRVQGETSGLIRERITAICFAEKNFLSGGLEITDLISYVTFFKVRGLLPQNKEKGLSIIWSGIKKGDFLKELTEFQVRKFFGIKKGEVHRNLA